MNFKKIFYDGLSYLVILTTAIAVFFTGYGRGYKEGSEIALDTCVSVIRNQYGSDSTLTKLTTVGKDTNTVYLTTETIRE